MSHRQTQQGVGTVIIAALVALLVYLLTKGGSFLHESVSAGIVTGAGTVTSDPATGYPQFDTRFPQTVPANAGSAVPPLDANGQANWNPANPLQATCPAGYQMWHNATDGTYQCLSR